MIEWAGIGFICTGQEMVHNSMYLPYCWDEGYLSMLYGAFKSGNQGDLWNQQT